MSASTILTLTLNGFLKISSAYLKINDPWETWDEVLIFTCFFTLITFCKALLCFTSSQGHCYLHLSYRYKPTNNAIENYNIQTLPGKTSSYARKPLGK